MGSLHYAHTPNQKGEWHLLTDHLRAVAEQAREFAKPFGGGELAYWAGLWHDVGKFRSAFQAYLKNPDLPRATEEKDHKTAGAVFSRDFGQWNVS